MEIIIMDNNKNKDWHLSNGFCFLAIEMKSPGEWSRHYDLSTCLAKMQSKPTIITLWYTHKTSECSWSGGVDFDKKYGEPINLGCYRIGGRGANFSIKGIDKDISKKYFTKVFENNKQFIENQ